LVTLGLSSEFIDTEVFFQTAGHQMPLVSYRVKDMIAAQSEIQTDFETALLIAVF
jgi:hypothetical protein